MAHAPYVLYLNISPTSFPTESRLALTKEKKGKGLVVIIVLALLGALGYFVGLPAWGRHLAATTVYPPLKFGENSIVYADDGTPMGNILASGKGESTLKAEQISPPLRQAFLAAEDRGFYTHDAIDPKAIAWAAIVNTQTGSFAVGGSSISQQYVKNAYLTKEKNLERYIKGIKLAYKLESDYSKDQILTMYANSIYYGKGATGVNDAALAWFGHPATDIKDINNPEHVAKAAFLASLVQRPSFFDGSLEGKPGELPEIELEKRIKYTLDGFLKIDFPDENVLAGKIASKEVVEKAKQYRFNIKALIQSSKNAKAGGTSDNMDPYLLTYIKDWLAATEAEAAKQLNESLSDEEAVKEGRESAKAILARGGYKFYTTINLKVQAAVNNAVSKLPKRGLSTGGVIMDPRTGAVLAMYGGSDFAKDGNNYALYAKRQPGSVMKTVVLADMVQKGYSPMSVLPAPACIKLDNNNPEQCNHNKKPGSTASCGITVVDAIAQSNNPVFLEAITGKMADCNDPANPTKMSPVAPGYAVTPKSVAELGRKLGADDSTVPARSDPATLDEVPSLALGTSSLTPLKLASMGSTIADGEHDKPYIVKKIVGSDEKHPAYEYKQQSERVLSEEHVRVINRTLTEVHRNGTAKSAKLPGYPFFAWKTGSTDWDAWSLAWSPIDPNKTTPAYLCSFWTGYPDNKKVTGVAGADVAKICQAVFADVLKGVKLVDFPPADLNAGKKIGLK